MAAPDWPRLPSGYRFEADAARLEVVGVRFDLDSDRRSDSFQLDYALRASVALALAAHAGEDRYAFALQDGTVVQGQLDRTNQVGHFLDQVGNANSALNALDGARLTLDVSPLAQDAVEAAVPETRTTPLLLRLVKADEESRLELSFDASILPQLEAQWFLAHVKTTATVLVQSDSSAAIGSLEMAPKEEAAILERYSSCPDTIHEPAAYPAEIESLPDFFRHAARANPTKPALHFIPDPTKPQHDAVLLTFSQLEYLARHLATTLLGSDQTQEGDCSGRGQQVVPVVVDKSPEMVISLLAIALAGYGYLALEPSFPEERKRGICAELQEKGMLAPVAIVQSSDGELDRWRSWTPRSDSGTTPVEAPRIFERIIDPQQTLAPLLARLAHDPSLDLAADELDSSAVQPSPSPTDVAYIIYTSGTTGKPKGIVVEQQNVAAFLRYVDFAPAHSPACGFPSSC